MPLQNQVYITPNLGRQGFISRQDPVPQSSPYIAEDDSEGNQIVTGAFVFDGTTSTQIKPTALAGTTPKGVAIYNGLQINVTGEASVNVIQGMNVQVLRRGCCFCQPPINASTVGEYVLVDPLTGAVQTSSTTSIAATSGSLDFDTVDSVIANWNAVTAGKLTLKVDGTDIEQTGLDFSTAVDLDDVATVLDTAFDGYVDVVVNVATTGLIFTSETTGASSSVSYVETVGDIAALLDTSIGNMTEVVGTNAYNDTGWIVKTENSANQVIEIEKL